MEWTAIRFNVIDSRAVRKNTSNGIIHSFTVTENNWNKSRTYKPDEIEYFKFEDDIDDSNNGMGILASVIYDAVLDLEALKSNYSLYKNSARPDMMLLLDGNLTQKEQQNAKDMFEAQFRWSENAHKVVVGGWIQDIKTLSLTAQDMEQIAQRKLTTEKIASAFGVPKAMLWYTDDVNYSNAVTLKEEFIEWTVKPMAEDFESMLNKLIQKFRPDIRENYRIKIDSEQLEETQEWMNGQRQDVMTWIITINEARVERWLERIDDENADKLLTTRNAVLLEDIALDATLSWDEI